MAKLKQALDAAFDPAAAMTAAFVVTWKGRLIAERYGKGITPHTPLESWSMGKSVTAALMGILDPAGRLRPFAAGARFRSGRAPGDPRAKIRIADLLHMSSGLRIRAPQDPDYDPAGPYPDHVYLYTGGVDAFHYAATRPLQWPPGNVGRYRNTDPVLTNYLVRLGRREAQRGIPVVPAAGAFRRDRRSHHGDGDRPVRQLPDAGIRASHRRATGRDSAISICRTACGTAKRILPEGFVKFVSTVAPAWQADRRPIYGGFFWINGDGAFPVPKDAYFMAGAGGQKALIVPSHDLVVVRMGHYRGGGPGLPEPAAGPRAPNGSAAAEKLKQRPNLRAPERRCGLPARSAAGS